LIADADLLLNLAVVNPVRHGLEDVPIRILIDEDPGFNQIKHLVDPVALGEALQHTAFFSFGENIGRETCSVPDDGIGWLRTRQPVVLDSVPTSPGHPHANFTTIMLWNSYPVMEYHGISYGMKSDSFTAYLRLPTIVGPLLELCVGGSDVPHELLRSHGWQLQDPLPVSRDACTYERYIRQSRAEFSVAKQGYVLSRSGWFSERTAAYLATGRPVVVQDTGFSEWMETGSGVIAFSTLEEAVAGIEEVVAHYDFHCRAAREIAETYFESNRVLTALIERASGRPNE